MSFTRYLEFDSSYRDRVQWPSPANFVIPFGSSGQRNKDTAADPVCNAAPILYWNSSFDETTAATTVTITGITFTTSPSDPYTFIITAAANDLRNVANFYAGAVLQLTDSAATPVTVYTRILTYKLTSTTSALVTVSTPLPTNFPTGAVSGSIQNPTNATNTALVPYVFIPAGSNGDNFYINFYIENITTGEFFTITAYDGVTHLATLSGNTAATWLQGNNNFAIRKAKPISTSTIVAINTTRPVAVQLQTTENPDTDSLNGSFLRMISPVPTAAGFSTLVSPYGEQARIGKYIAGVGTLETAAVIGTNTFTLAKSTSSSQDGAYVNAIITVGADSLRIATYDGATRSGTLVSNWTAGHVAGATWYMNTAILSSTFGTNPTAGQTYELELFTRDNLTPLNYAGSITSVSQEVCCDVELVNLILPNSLLACGRGGRAIFYPYLYVNLKQISGTDVRNILISNNPNSVTMKFRAVVDDTTQPVYSPFIKIDGDSMTHTIKFKPTDSFQLTVTLPNGELFATVATDFFSPTEPNPLVQISACFSFKRNDGK